MPRPNSAGSSRKKSAEQRAAGVAAQDPGGGPSQSECGHLELRWRRLGWRFGWRQHQFERIHPSSGSSGSGSGFSAPSVSSSSGLAVQSALGQLGVPYRFATSNPGVAFDCSGLTKYAWGQAGVDLPHQSAAQFASTPHVPKDQAQPGDLIFYYSPISHVGIYLGGGMLVHAPNTGKTVKVGAVNWGKVVGVGRPG